jgi:hypothetical protein
VVQSLPPIIGRFAPSDLLPCPIHKGFSDRVWYPKVGVFSKMPFLDTFFSPCHFVLRWENGPARKRRIKLPMLARLLSGYKASV